MNYYVYQLRASDESLPFYIGKSTVGNKRLVEHLSNARTGSKRMTHKKIRKVLARGAEILEEILFWFDSEQKALDREIELIAQYGRRDIETGILTNHTDGGEGTNGTKHTVETRQRMSLAKMGNKNNVGVERPDMVERYSKPVTVFDLDGNILGTYASGKEAAAELQVSYSTLNDCVRGVHKACKSKSSGLKYQVRDGVFDQPIPPIRFKQSAGLGEIEQRDKDGRLIATFVNSKDAKAKTGISDITIRNVINGIQKTAGGFLWNLKK